MKQAKQWKMALLVWAVLIPAVFFLIGSSHINNIFNTNKGKIMEKQIAKITQHQIRQNAPGFNSVDLYHSEHNIEPFLVFTEFHMDRPIFGPHPHAGVSVMTYMMPDSKGSFLNRDSRGDSSIIEPGGIHVTQAGSGVKHDEVPTEHYVDCHGFQIWINHADKDRLVAPKAYHAASKDVPEYKNEQVFVRVVQGEYATAKSPIELVTQTTILDVTLQPNSTVEFEAAEMAFIYLVEGSLTTGGSTASDKALIKFTTEGQKVTVKTTEQTAHFMFVTGTPHNEPIVYGGPFVMTTSEQMQETQRRLQRGEMGVLNHL
jgi:quercetin 2,3-dioxygenase